MKRGAFLLVLFLAAVSLQAQQWRAHGPSGSWVRSLAAAPSNPSMLYVASFAGVYRSTDDGATWTNISGPPNAFLLTVDPADEDTVYAASDQQPDRLFKSQDGGRTWTPLSQFQEITSIVIDPRDANIVYVSSNCLLPDAHIFGGVFKSVDGGATFVASTSGMIGFQICIDTLALDPVRPDTLYTTPFHSDNGAARSDDGGLSWTRATGFIPSSGSIADPRDARRRYGSANGTLVGSTDDGATWDLLAPVVLNRAKSGAAAQAMDLDPSSGRLFFGGSNGSFRSGDGGRSALALPAAGTERISGLTFNETTGTLTIGTDTGLYQTRDFATWTPLDTGDRGQFMRNVEPSRRDPATLYAISAHRAFVSRDGGLTWSYLGDPLLKTADQAPTLVDLAVDVDDNVYVFGRVESNEKLYKLARDAQQWTELTPPIPEFDGVLADPGTAGVVYLIRFGAPGLIATRDGGATWSDHFTPRGEALSLAIDPRDGKVFYAGSYRGVYQSVDGGHTWVEKTLDVAIRDIQISPVDPDTLYAMAETRVFASTDAGLTWTERGTFANVRSIAPDRRDARAVYLATSDGVFRSRNAGATWEPLGFDAPRDFVHLATNLSGSMLHAAGRGIWRLPLVEGRRRSVGPSP